MTENSISQPGHWPVWQRIAFRFFFVFFFLQVAPWTWPGNIPGYNYLIGWYGNVMDWIVSQFNRYWFHFPKTTIVNNGSGDTSVAWEELFTYLSVAMLVCIIWSIADKKRKSYTQANYVLTTCLRYYVIIACFSYGVLKLYGEQMIFPNQSQLATPLGDFLPMRLSWLFIGYSTPYEMFSGIMEIAAGILLLNRKTITLGLLVALIVFSNVMALNLSYDIPVKMYSMCLVLYCLYLLINDSKRLLRFFIFNRAVGPNTMHQITFPKKWMRVTRYVLKTVFILLFACMPFYEYWSVNTKNMAGKNIKPLQTGVYDVISYAVNKDTLVTAAADTLRWKDLIIEQDGSGSVGSTDTAFRQRYRRGYFSAVMDTVRQTITLKKTAAAKNAVALFHYSFSDSNTIVLSGHKYNDSLYVVLRKSNRHFQLTERQFHWISEANR